MAQLLLGSGKRQDSPLADNGFYVLREEIAHTFACSMQHDGEETIIV